MLLNVITLIILGIIDLKKNKIPNAVLMGWVLMFHVSKTIEAIPIKSQTLILAGLTAGIYFPLRQIVVCYSGDFKLFAVIMLVTDPHNALVIIFISMLISLIPLACGVKKVPIALMTLFGYTAFLLFNHWFNFYK